MQNTRGVVFALGAACVAVVAVLGGRAYTRSDVQPVNDLPNPYRRIEPWATMPEGRAWGKTAAADIDLDGRSVWVAERCGDDGCVGSPLDPVLKFDPSGELVTSFGAGMFVWPHGIDVDPEGNIWVTDARGEGGKGHQVFKFSPDGEVLLTLGTPGVAGDGPAMFNQPSDVVVAPNGDIFVGDGHGGGQSNDRIVKFSRDGTFLKSWGKTGSGPGEFRQPHGLDFDSRGRLFVADRGNNRIQIFDQEGRFIDQWGQFGRPSGIFITENDRLYVADSDSWGPENPEWKKGIRIGSARDGSVESFIEDIESTSVEHAGAEGVAVDVLGNVYGAVVRRQMLEKHVRRNSQLTFTEHTVATGVERGYQVVVVDVNADGLRDLIAVASALGELAWFENPGWERHVIVEGRTEMYNLAARDLDGDDIPEVVLAEGFSTRPRESVGNILVLTHQGDPTALWSVREIDRVPASHRLRWMDVGDGEALLLNAPLAGADLEPPEYRGETPLYAYDPRGWTRTLVANDGGVVHDIEPVAWNGPYSPESFLSASFLGVHLHEYSEGRWTRTRIHAGDPAEWPESGASEADLGQAGGRSFVASIEPWHGHQVVVYTKDGEAWNRSVIDDTLENIHALAVGDLDGDGTDEIVAGARGSVEVVVYRASDGTWSKQMIDDGGLAATECVLDDLNLDGRLDIICVGQATANLKWYENTTS